MSEDRPAPPPDRLDRLYRIASHYAARFPENATALGYLSRLTEELGEIAVEVQRLEGAPAKLAKHGPGTLRDLASEVEDLLHTALGLVRHYQAEAEFDAVLDEQYRRVTG